MDEQLAKYWWLKRLSIAVLLLIILLGSLRWWWGWKAQQLLAQEIQLLKANAERMDRQDFNLPPVPAERNGTTLIAKARTINGAISSAETLWTAGFNGRLPLSAYDRKILGGLETQRAEVLQLMRAARIKGGIDWGPDATEPAYKELVRTRQLASFLQQMALYSMDRGNNDEAWERIRDTLFLANAVASEGSGMTPALCAMGVYESTCQTILEMTHGTSAATQGVISDLLNDRPAIECLVRGIEGARLQARETWPHDIQKMVPPIFLSMMSPAYILDERRLLRNMEQTRNAATQPNFQSSMAALPAGRRLNVFGVWDVTKMGSEIKRLQTDALMRSHFMGLLDRRFAAIALATKRFETYQNGKMPANWDDLVPLYLTVIPADPFASDGRGLKYAARKKMVYSVGSNNTDDGGNDMPMDPKSTSAQRHLRFDIVYRIN